MKDWRGNEIHVGDTVVYPGRQGSSMWMNEGVVQALEPGDDNDTWKGPDVIKVRRQFDNGWRGWRDGDKVNAERVVAVQAHNVTVVPARGVLQTYEEYQERYQDIDMGAT